MGADEVINSRQVDCAAEARHMTRGRGVDAVVEMVGLSETLEAILGSVGKGGRIVFGRFYDKGRIRPVITRACKLEEADEVLRSMARMALAGRACAVLF
jgi:D-arabinose 1-dehydrogenase-like Zn-dependent alcohol dehydrogenase